MNIPIARLWDCHNEDEWKSALEEYWRFVKPGNRELEEELNNLNVTKPSDIADWYSFLLDKYFRWKYTAPNRYATTTKHFKKAFENNHDKLDEIVDELFSFDFNNIGEGLITAKKISGLGIAGTSSLLSLLFPKYFGGVDQFVVKALRNVRTLPKRDHLLEINPESIIKISDGVLLIGIMRRKANELNSEFNSNSWTPRKIDMILWSRRQ